MLQVCFLIFALSLEYFIHETQSVCFKYGYRNSITGCKSYPFMYIFKAWTFGEIPEFAMLPEEEPPLIKKKKVSEKML